MEKSENYYLPDEEKFGFLTSHFYNLFAGITPMKNFHQFVLKSVLSGKPKRILDIGFGTGHVMKQMVQSDAGMEVYGVEPSASMFNVAKRKLRKQIESGKVKISLGSSRDIPFEEKFDVIYTSLSFHHWQNQGESILNILNYLQPDGQFLVLEYGDDLIQGYKKAVKAHALSKADLEKLSEIADFEVHDSGEYRCVSFKPGKKGQV